MKKFLSMLTLVLALCLACGAALAAVQYDYSNPIIVENADGTVIVKFPSTTPVSGDKYEFQEWKVYVDAPKYKELKNVTAGDLIVVKPATCTDDAVLALAPTNVATTLRTSNAADTVNDPATADDLKHTGYSYYGLLAQFAKNKTVDMAELAKANKALYALYKATGHDYTTGLVRVVKAATCEEEGLVVHICSKCKAEGTVEKTEALGHESLLTKAQVKKLVKDGSIKVNNHEYELLWEPNCSEEGLYEGYCQVCGEDDVLFDIPVDLNVHAFGAWLTEKAATCTTAGLEYRLCTLCLKAKEQRIVDPLGHKMVPNVIKPSTCMESGTADKFTCIRCTVVVTVNANGVVVKNAKDDVDGKNILDAVAKQAISIDPLKKLFILNPDPTNHPSEYWELNTMDSKLPSCEKDGMNVYRCRACNNSEAYKAVVPATGHKMITVIQKNDNGTWKEVKQASCELKADGKPYEYRALTFCDNEAAHDAAKKVQYAANGYPVSAANAAKTLTPTVATVKAPDHTYDRWVMRNAPASDTPGYWIRECKVCHVHDEYIGYVAPVEPNDNGLILGDDGVFYYYVAGVIDTTFNGVVDYNGAKFLVVDGKVDGSVSGLKLVGDEFLFFANNQLQAVDTFAIYDGAMFVIKAGKLDLSANGLLDYNGGKFVFAAGQLKADVNGLWLNPADNTWCFLANGQLQAQYSGIASYDGAYFLLKDGKLATGAAGTYEQDGVKYIVDDAGNAAIAA